MNSHPTHAQMTLSVSRRQCSWFVDQVRSANRQAPQAAGSHIIDYYLSRPVSVRLVGDLVTLIPPPRMHHSALPAPVQFDGRGCAAGGGGVETPTRSSITSVLPPAHTHAAAAAPQVLVNVVGVTAG
eukprot:GHVU01233869.1.p1 GENE.GHVU01233869.1~~GHVU01233869.1.p1  ORF type:complete len:127 (-),score=16.73 GHVU01233869.1:8-388(-)